MNKLRMIVTSVIVLAIVGSAFAFTEKRAGAFCVSNQGANLNCFVITDCKIVDGIPNFWYQQNWNSVPAGCPGNCLTPVRLVIN
jgi:hypothetical protein